MLSFGSTDNHSNALDFGDLDSVDGNVRYAIGLWFKRLAAAAASRFIFANGRLFVSTDSGYALEAGTGYRVRHGDGVLMTAVDFTADFSDGATHSVFYAWTIDDAVRFYFDGILVAETAYSTNRAANALSFVLGNNSDKDKGFPCQIGHYMNWHQQFHTVATADAAAALFHAGETIPNPEKLAFWHKGLASPGADEISGTIPSVTGTVTTASDAVDAYYQSSNEQFRSIGSHRLRRRRTEEQLYRVRVPFYVAAPLDLMDMVNVAHESVPASATKLSGIEDHALIPKWRRYIGRVVGIEHNLLDLTTELSIKDHESFMTTFWSTDVLPLGTNGDFNGLARLDLGATRNVDRGSKAYLEQSYDIEISTSEAIEGEFFREVSVGNEKMNHIGFLAEDATDNPILNSAAKNSETSWTATANGGTIDIALRVAYPSAVTGGSAKCFHFSRTSDAADTYRTQTFAVLLTDAFRRVYLTKHEESATDIVSFRLQRSTDSFFWNDATPGWQAGTVWNNLTNRYDTGNSLSIISREVSDVISVSADQNWTLDFGLEGASLPAGGGEIFVYGIEALKGHLIYSSVPTDAAVTTVEDTVTFTRAALPQIVSATRGSVTFQLEAIQAGGDLIDGNELCLLYWQYGSTSDYDAVLYEKQSAETVRFSYVRIIAGAADARAFLATTIVPGTVYNITCVWSDNTGDELDEAASLLRIYVDGTQGTDDNGSANHDDTDVDTELWKGCAPSGTGYLRADNYLRHITFIPRVLTAEEVPT